MLLVLQSTSKFKEIIKAIESGKINSIHEVKTNLMSLELSNL